MLGVMAACSPGQSDAPPGEPTGLPAPPTAPAGGPVEDPSALLAVDAATREEVIDAAATALRDRYVFPGPGNEAATAIQDHLDNGDYAALDQGLDFAERLTDDLQEVTDDRHLRLVFHPPVPPGQTPHQPPDAPPPPGAAAPHGLSRVDTIEDDVGLIAIREFAPPNQDTVSAVAEAMGQVADTDALVFDLRDTLGGSPGTVALWCSYLLGPEPVDLDTFRGRDGEVQQRLTTRPDVDGPRYTDREVFLLTSQDTFSGGEHFAYDLKHLDRATIVGQTTAGAANVIRPTPLTDTFDLALPETRPVNAVTGTNWEGTGVTPHITVPAEQALETAVAEIGRD